ncbi:carbohydrate porin [Vulcanococcus limneticus Candia 3F8]|uniref:iron uptake porin n=2 Tax=Vulcanococcus limneticus TaxID=2170428 RepID=UPI000B991EB5|nr:iron uptake porin [Vulcanococcus limneticus]MCP9792617.1 carbohydrate porin [Vulcanococcus limneticus MW73D5]MCP9894344.1 carbohydrate porin [Vulcanococcus limneticus Candia 3F8]MCP9898009.1 carbohydrate porin [Vulcanococcus limneticus Candia 3B3]
MKLFQKLLLAPAALGLMAPVAASAADLNLAGVNQYATSDEQVTSITQFSDVQPTDWAYQALSNLIERYGCVAGYPNGTFKGRQAMTRYEAAALLNACLDRITEVTDELKRLMKEFEKELAVLKGRVDGLEAKVGELEATQFSTTTKLKGVATFVLGANSFGGSVEGLRDAYRASEGATTFNYDVRLNFDTSFTGKDLLRTTLRAGNFANSGFGGGYTTGTNDAALGLNQLEVAFQGASGADSVEINRLFYQFPIGNGFTATVGGKVRQDDMLAMWPSVYPADTVLDIFTYAGAPGAYNLNLGAGAGLWYQKNGWNLSLNYVSGNAQNGSPNDNFDNCGGIGTDCAAQTGTAQVGYAASNWGIAAVYNYSNGVGPASGTPLAVLGGSGVGNLFDTVNSVGLSAYWQPKTNGWVPSISAGWGINSYNEDNAAANFDGVASQSWYVGLQWQDAFVKGNALGMAVGQPTFITSCGDFCDRTPQDAGYAWEWWYKFQVTDNISVTPAIFYLSNPLGAFGNAARVAAGENGAAVNNFGGLVKTTFKF